MTPAAKTDADFHYAFDRNLRMSKSAVNGSRDCCMNRPLFALERSRLKSTG